MLWNCCPQYTSKFGKLSSGHWKRSVFTPIPKKSHAKERSNYRTIALISHASKVMLKILQATLHKYKNHEISDVQAGFRKGRGTKDQIANICWIIKKGREFQKKSTSALLTMQCWLCLWLHGSQEAVENSQRDGNTRPPDLPLEKPMQVRKQQLELHMEQQTVSK